MVWWGGESVGGSVVCSRAVAHNFGKLSESSEGFFFFLAWDGAPLDQFLNYMQSIPNAN